MINYQRNVSENLQAASSVCQSLTVDELLELALLMGNEKEGFQNREEWATAIASTLEGKIPNRVKLN